jgi:hypothetical protein
MQYVVSVSGGLGSYEALRRCLEKHGRAQTAAVFADVGSVIDAEGNHVSGEDPDLFRFLDEIERHLDFPIHRIRSQKYADIWDVFFAQRMMGSTQRDPCSRHLKRQVIDEWKRAHFGQVNVMTVIGLSWLEKDRAREFRAVFGDLCWFPLCDPPYVINDDIIATLGAVGIAPPRLYARGFSHNNCGGFCVKMGLFQAWLLWSTDLPRFLHHESREAEFRAKFARSDVTIFRRSKEPVTMAQLRESFEAGWQPRQRKDRSCASCMLPAEDEFAPSQALTLEESAA